MARILAVEDDPVTRLLVERQLENAGHQVISVSSAEQAMIVVEERGAPDLAVLDVGLPDTDGLSLLRRLRQRSELGDLPAVFLSAKVEEVDVEAGRAMGAVYLTKPFVATALLSAVDRLLPSPPRGW